MRTSSKIKISLLITQVILSALIFLQLYKCDEVTVAKVDSFDVVNIDKVVQVPEPSTIILISSAFVLFKLTRNV